MKSLVPALFFIGASTALRAHEWTADPHSHTHPVVQTNPEVAESAAKAAPPQATSFAMFAPKVALRWDQKFLYVESNGLPSHNMMVGITAWQQQVPLPQAYTGANAWRIPLSPVPAKEGQPIKDHFLRGAIALAANGIPIFNPQNNRGEISAMIGELDEWGGHCGRADDYHYHAAPLHLQKVVGIARPIAFALDGYPIYGPTEPDGSPPAGLDSFNGHSTPALGYHYHSSTKYPYINGGFHGEVVEREGQVDPQPRANGVREALPALSGAKITGFESTGENRYKLSYEVNGEKRAVLYAIQPDGTFPFEFQDGSTVTRKEVYTLKQAGGRRPREERPPRREGGGERRPAENQPQQGESRFGPDTMKKPAAGFILSSPAVRDDGKLPIEFTGDGRGDSPPLFWRGAPAGTRSYALLMDHLTPDNQMKHYWTMWDIPASVTDLPRNARDIGKLGKGFKGQLGYEPPHSKGPGVKTYEITVFALSSPLSITRPPGEVDRDVLLAAMQDKVLASASMKVVCETQAKESPASPPPLRPNAENRQPALVKPTIDDTVKLNVYADNWFMLYVNGRLVAVDPIQFTPHNVVSVDFLPEYPMTIAVLAKDNADPKTGLEYGSSIGDGGFILKFGDGTVTNASWKAKSFFHGPVNGETGQPKARQEPLPADWWTIHFDDHSWQNAREFTAEDVDPKQPYFDHDFKDARFIWTDDLALDNTVVFRTRIEKPGWKPRWNTQPDLDVTGRIPGLTGDGSPARHAPGPRVTNQ